MEHGRCQPETAAEPDGQPQHGRHGQPQRAGVGVGGRIGQVFYEVAGQYQAGDLRATIPLAPGEVRKYSKKVIKKTSVATKNLEKSMEIV